MYYIRNIIWIIDLILVINQNFLYKMTYIITYVIL